MNLPNWTGGCTRQEVRVAIEVKHLMSTSVPPETPSLGFFRGTELLVSAPKGPHEVLNLYSRPGTVGLHV